MSLSKSKYKYELPNHVVKHGVTVKLADLRVETQPQRALNERRAQAISRSLVPSALGAIVVSKRGDGSMWIVDGQHRVRAALLAGLKTLTAEVHENLSLNDEAVLFMLNNNESQRVGAVDLYHVGLTAGADLQVDIQNVLDKHGLKVSTASSANNLAAIRCVEDVVRRYGTEALDRAIAIAEAAWGRDSQSWEGTLIGGLGEFLGKHGADVDDKTLVAKIQRKGTQNKWLMLSTGHMVSLDSGGSAVSKRHGCYRALKVEWNKNRRVTDRLA